MKESSALRRWTLGAALAATVAAAGWVGGNQEAGRVTVLDTVEKAQSERPEAPERRADVAGRGADGTVVDLDKLMQRDVTRKFGEMFPARSWQPPPPPPSARKPEPPRAPPLPFRFFGRMVENGTTVVFLDRQDEIFAVKAGDTVAGAYRVEEINGAEVVLTYLPLQQRQTLPIGAIQ
jgi:hypothetical protein